MSIAETTAACVAESEFTQHNCRCKRYKGYNVIRNDSATNSTILLSCPVPTVCVRARANARWTLSGLDAGSAIFETDVEGPYLLNAIDGFTIGVRNGLAFDPSTGNVFVRSDIPKLLSKVDCSVTVYVFPPSRDSTTTSETTRTTGTSTVRRRTPDRRPTTSETTTTMSTTTEPSWTTATDSSDAWSRGSTVGDGLEDVAASSVRFQTFGKQVAVTVPLISQEDQTPLFVILGLLLLCLALSLLFAILYVRGAVGHRGGQWDRLARSARFINLPRIPRALRETVLPEAVPSLP